MTHESRFLLAVLAVATPAIALAGDEKPPAPPDAASDGGTPAKSAPAASSCPHTVTIYGAKERCWRSQKHLERAEKLGAKIEYFDVDADPAAKKYVMANKEHLSRDSKGEIQLPLVLVDGKFIKPELKELSAACAAK